MRRENVSLSTFLTPRIFMEGQASHSSQSPICTLCFPRHWLRCLTDHSVAWINIWGPIEHIQSDTTPLCQPRGLGEKDVRASASSVPSLFAYIGRFGPISFTWNFIRASLQVALSLCTNKPNPERTSLFSNKHALQLVKPFARLMRGCKLTRLM